MRTLISVSALAFISNLAVAETFQYENQLASPDLDPNIESLSANVSNPEISATDFELSLNAFYRGNPDVGHDLYQYEGTDTSGSLQSTAYDAWVRGNPDADSSV